MEIKSKKTITGIALGTILVAGIFTVFPQSASADLTALDKIGTIINILLNIQEDLQDKLTLMVTRDDNTPVVLNDARRAMITVRALDADEEFVNFNLKEVYVCGTIFTDESSSGAATGSLVVRGVGVEGLDIRIRNDDDSFFVAEQGTVIVNDSSTSIIESCADVITLISNTGRAGEVGLGSDSDVKILLQAGGLSGDERASIDLVKCIAFVPQEAVTLDCETEVVEGG